MGYQFITYEAEDHIDLTTLIEEDITLNSWTPINVTMSQDSYTGNWVAAVLYSHTVTPGA